MKVLLVTRKWPPAVGGMERWSVEIAEALPEYCELEVIKLPGRDNGMPPTLWKLALFMLTTAWKLPGLTRDYDAVIYGDMLLFPLAWWNSKRIGPRYPRQLLMLHGLDTLYHRRAGIGPAVYGWLMKWAADHQQAVDRFVCNSEATSESLGRSGFQSRAVVPLAVRLAKPTPLQAIHADDRFCLFYGRIFRRKGALWFAENVLPLLPDDIRLKVVGKVWDKAEGVALAQHPRVDLLGSHPDQVSADELARLKATAICSVLPNVKNPDGQDIEGFGLTALELADSGPPVLVADHEGLRDAVRNGETGWRIPPEDAYAWAAKIKEVLLWVREERTAHAERARASMAECYSWSRVARDYLKLAEKPKK